MTYETEEPVLGSADAQLVDPGTLIDIQDAASTSVVEEHMRKDEVANKIANLSLTVNGKPVSPEILIPHDTFNSN